MPYVPLGYQTPIPPQGQTLWDTPPPTDDPRLPNGMPDLSNVPLFGRRGFAAGLDKFGPGILRDEILPFVTGPILGKAMQLAPRATLALTGWLADPREAGGAEQVKSQRTLREEAKAKAEAARAEAAKAAADLAKEGTRKLEVQEAAKKAEEERRQQAAAEAAAATIREQNRAAAGRADEKLQNAPQSAPEEYGTLAGTLGGLVLGYGMQGGLLPKWLGGSGGAQGKITAAKAAEAARANKLVDDIEAGAAAGNVPRQVGSMNQFVTEGGGQRPFTPISDAPYWKTNPDAPDFSRLYQSRTPAQNYGPLAIGTTVAGIEGYAGHNIYTGARDERLAAEQAFRELGQSDKPVTDAEYTTVIQKLLAARKREAIGDALTRLGIYSAVGTGAGELKARLPGGMPRPDVGRAEAAYGNINRDLNVPAAPPPLPPTPPLSPGPLYTRPQVFQGPTYSRNMSLSGDQPILPARKQQSQHPAGATDSKGNKIGGQFKSTDDD